MADDLSGGVTAIYASLGAFAAIKTDGSVVTWGDPERGGDSGAVANDLGGGVTGISSPFPVEPIEPVVPPEAPVIDAVEHDDVIAPDELDFGMIVSGSADPDARVTVTFGEARQTVPVGADGTWRVLFDLEDIPASGAHLVTAQAERAGLTSPITERNVTVENTPAQIFGQSTGELIEGDPQADTMRGTLLVFDRDEGEDRFLRPDGDDLDSRFGNFDFDPLTGDWMFTLNNDSPAVRALGDGEQATATLTVTSHDGTASETITVTITGAGVRDPGADGVLLLSGQVVDRAGDELPGTVLTFSPHDGETLVVGTDLAGRFSLELAVGSAGHLNPARDYDDGDPGITAASALEALRMAVGLDTSWGPPEALDFIAADCNGDGQVTAADALDILRVAVGLEAEASPRWIFVDSETDLAQVDRSNTHIETGRHIDPIAVDMTDVSFVGVLVGHLQEYG